LNLTQGAVSRQLQVLEGQLGVALLIRDKHRLRLTPAAQDFVTEARAALGLAPMKADSFAELQGDIFQ
jgi:DNA-binding transcriptional LysR family regulator